MHWGSMTVISFPPIESADEDGLLAVGGDLAVESLLKAYRSGIFPWPVDEHALLWFAPPSRAIIMFDELHVSRRLVRSLRANPFEHTIDNAFAEVTSRCAEVKNRGDQNGTWITSQVASAYCEMHRQGHCHSVESWRNGELVGGIYGVKIGRYFAAESSFYRAPDASKAAMCHLVSWLAAQGVTWLDCQVITPFSSSFGAREVLRADFMEMLRKALL